MNWNGRYVPRKIRCPLGAFSGISEPDCIEPAKHFVYYCKWQSRCGTGRDIGVMSRTTLIIRTLALAPITDGYAWSPGEKGNSRPTAVRSNHVRATPDKKRLPWQQ